MKWLKLLGNSFCIAVILTCLADLFKPYGGYYLLEPGMFLEGFCTVLIWLQQPDEVYFSFPEGAHYYFNVLFYTPAIFFVLFVAQHLDFTDLFPFRKR